MATNRFTVTDPIPRPETHKRVRSYIGGGYIIRTMTNAEAEEAVRNGSQIEGAQRPECGIAMRAVQPSYRP